MADAYPGQTCRWNLAAASFLNGENLPRALTISATGEVTADNAAAAKAINLEDVIVFPALVNSHDHLEFSLYPVLGQPPYSDVDEWARDVHGRYASVVAAVEEISPEIRRFWGALKNLMCGVTTVMDHCDPRGRINSELPIDIIEPFRFVHRADTRWSWLRAKTNRGAGPLVFHVAEGSSKKVVRRSVRFLRALGSQGSLIGIHGINLGTESAQRLDALVWCPVSNQFLFGQTADIALLKRVTAILFGTDASISAQGTIWDHFRVARECGGLSATELLDSVTTTASKVWGLRKTSDLVIARRRHADPWESFFEITAADIQAVISRRRLVLMSENFYQDFAPDDWCDKYRAIIVGDVRQRLYAQSADMLTRLASVQNAPLTLP